MNKWKIAVWSRCCSRLKKAVSKSYEFNSIHRPPPGLVLIFKGIACHDSIYSNLQWYWFSYFLFQKIYLKSKWSCDWPMSSKLFEKIESYLFISEILNVKIFWMLRIAKLRAFTLRSCSENIHRPSKQPLQLGQTHLQKLHFDRLCRTCSHGFHRIQRFLVTVASSCAGALLPVANRRLYVRSSIYSTDLIGGKCSVTVYRRKCWEMK